MIYPLSRKKDRDPERAGAELRVMVLKSERLELETTLALMLLQLLLNWSTITLASMCFLSTYCIQDTVLCIGNMTVYTCHLESSLKSLCIHLFFIFAKSLLNHFLIYAHSLTHSIISSLIL